MGGPDIPAHTTQTTTSKIELPKWVEDAGVENYQLAKDIGQTPYEKYGGQLNADMPPEMQQAFDYYQSNVGKAQGMFDEAAGGMREGMNYDAATDHKRFLNPFTDEVESRALANLDRSREMALMSNQDKASAAGAFGGSRHGIIDGVTNAESSRAAGDLSAQLRSQNYGQAMANSQANQGVRQNAAAGLAATADTTQKSLISEYAGMMDIGGRKQADQQQQLDTDYAQWREGQDHPAEMLNMRLAALGMTPYGRTESGHSEKTGTPASSGTDWVTAALGGAQLMGSIFGFSDDDVKTDKEKVGTDPDTGLDVWAFRYKSDPKTYPKTIGLMASDIEKRDPKAVQRVGGKKGKRVVNYSRALAMRA